VWHRTRRPCAHRELAVTRKVDYAHLPGKSLWCARSVLCAWARPENRAGCQRDSVRSTIPNVGRRALAQGRTPLPLYSIPRFGARIDARSFSLARQGGGRTGPRSSDFALGIVRPSLWTAASGRAPLSRQTCWLAGRLNRHPAASARSRPQRVRECMLGQGLASRPGSIVGPLPSDN